MCGGEFVLSESLLSPYEFANMLQYNHDFIVADDAIISKQEIEYIEFYVKEEM
jgi:hypothetical protein